MAIYLKPHTPDWFRALSAFDEVQAAATQRIIESAGRDDVCSICGDHPAADYKLIGEKLSSKAVATIRLCDDCRVIRAEMYEETYAVL
jgi:hypothetical protein